MRSLLLALTMAVASVLGFAQVDSSAAHQILDSLNSERTSRGLKPLVFDDRLAEAALQHSRVMSQHHAISHQFPQEASMTDRVVAAGVHVDAVGENVASSQSAARAHAALMHSPPHRANILNPNFNSVGIGVFRSENSLYVTQDFARVVADFTVEQAEKRVADFIEQVRSRAGAKPLPLVPRPELRNLACEMAHKDFLSMAGIRTLPNVSTTVVFTVADLQVAPKPLQRLSRVDGSGVSVGICHAASRSEKIPVYWVAVVTYF